MQAVQPIKLYPKKKCPSQRRTERVEGIHKKYPAEANRGAIRKEFLPVRKFCYMNTFIIAYFYKFVKPISKNYTCC